VLWPEHDSAQDWLPHLQAHSHEPVVQL